jgi:predicted transcriptional regulator of viral defense system
LQTTRSHKSKTQAALDLVRELRIVRPQDLAARKIPPDYLDRLHRRGLIERVGRGLYAWPDADLGENQTLAEAARQVPKGVICLLSALRFHGLTTQAPHEVWMALSPKAWLPRVEHPKLRLLRFSGRALTESIEEHDVEGTKLRIYSPAKTIADCFKYRNKVGLDVALEALRDCWRQRRCTMDDLSKAARFCRMTNVMRPYLESLT